MHIQEKHGVAVLTIRSNDEEATVRKAIAKELRRGYRVNGFDDADDRALIFTAWATPTGFGVRRGIIAGKFDTEAQAASDAARGIGPHFERPVRFDHVTRDLA